MSLVNAQIDENYNETLCAVGVDSDIVFPLLVDPITGELLCEMDNGDVIAPNPELENVKYDENYNNTEFAYDEDNDVVRPLLCGTPMNGTEELPNALLCDAIEVGV
jgi:hypothetical protein